MHPCCIEQLLQRLWELPRRNMVIVEHTALPTNGTLYLTNMGRLSSIWGFI
jgi:hypothetical protein